MPNEVNFLPNPASAYEVPAVYYGDINANGQGSPEGVAIGWPGAVYLDKDTGDFYKKDSGDGTTTGWVLLASGSSGAGGVLPTSGHPEGVLTAGHLQLAWDDTAHIGYIHEGADGTNTGWREIIA